MTSLGFPRPALSSLATLLGLSTSDLHPLHWSRQQTVGLLTFYRVSFRIFKWMQQIRLPCIIRPARVSKAVSGILSYNPATSFVPTLSAMTPYLAVSYSMLRCGPVKWSCLFAMSRLETFWCGPQTTSCGCYGRSRVSGVRLGTSRRYANRLGLSSRKR